MIVQPDFLTHWKTQMLIGALNDPCAPLYVIALWGHCQSSRRDRLENVTGEMIKAICRAQCCGELLLNALCQCGFLEKDGNVHVVHDWARTNARLLHNWSAGTLGGRPAKPLDNPRVSQTKPIREDKIREDKSTHPKSPPAPTHAVAWSSAEGWSGISQKEMEEWSVAYPACDLKRQLGAMSAWLHANPAKAVKRNWRRFITNWLSKAQDRGGDLLSRGNGQHQPELPKRRSSRDLPYDEPVVDAGNLVAPDRARMAGGTSP